MFFFSHQWQMCHDFKYFEQHIEVFIKKVKNTCALELIPIWIGMTWMPIPTWIRQNDADPTGSGSTPLSKIITLCGGLFQERKKAYT
jgi:hypothetical protein